MNPPGSDELTNFLLSRQQKLPADIDWTTRRQEWARAIEQLYQLITEDLLADAIAHGLVTVTRRDKEIEEEYLGVYRVPELVLEVSGETVRISPKGRNVIGTKGRVDLVGELDTMTLVLEPDGVWSLILSRTPRQVVPLDSKTLAEALRRVMR